MREKEPFNNQTKSYGICRECYQKVMDKVKSPVRGNKKENIGILKHKNRRVKTKVSGEVLKFTNSHRPMKMFLVSTSKLLLEGICKIVKENTNIRVVAEASKLKEIEGYLTEGKPEFLFLDNRTHNLGIHDLVSLINEKSPSTKVLLFGYRIKNKTNSPNIISIDQKTCLSEFINIIKAESLDKANRNIAAKMNLEASKFRRLSQNNAEIAIATYTQGNPITDRREIETEFENDKGQETENKSGRRNRYDEFRFLDFYVKEMARESLLSPKEEIEISAEIKKYEARAKRIRSLILKLSNEKVSVVKSNIRQYGKGKESLKRAERLNALMDTYLDRARELKQKFVKSNLRFVIRIANGFKGRGLPLLDLIC
ncbi:MAG TPA: hypothetical protein VHT73_15510 [Thermodesulfobacteriota bacterium]|nr:hypothetical protein [Thermodesulfobacteriota bacterium]